MAVPPSGLSFATNFCASATLVLAGGVELAEKLLGLGREADDLEAVVGVQIGETKLKRLFGLDEFVVVGHGAGGIEDEGDVLGEMCGLRLHAGRSEEEEVAVLVGGRVG